MKKTNLIIIILVVANILMVFFLILKQGTFAARTAWPAFLNLIFITWAIKKFEKKASGLNLIFLFFMSSVSLILFTVFSLVLVGNLSIGMRNEETPAMREEDTLSFRIVQAIGVSFALVGSIVGKKIGFYLKFISVPCTLSMSFILFTKNSSDLFDLYSLILLFASMFIATRKDKEDIANILKQDNKSQN